MDYFQEITVTVHVNVPEIMFFKIVYSCTVATSSGHSREVSWLPILLYASTSTVLLMGNSCSHSYQLTLVNKAESHRGKKIFTVCADYISACCSLHCAIEIGSRQKKDQDNLWKFFTASSASIAPAKLMHGIKLLTPYFKLRIS